MKGETLLSQERGLPHVKKYHKVILKELLQRLLSLTDLLVTLKIRQTFRCNEQKDKYILLNYCQVFPKSKNNCYFIYTLLLFTTSFNLSTVTHTHYVSQT